MKRIFFIIISLLSLQLTVAQQVVTVKGKTSASSEDFYYVTILSVQDSAVIDYRYCDTPEFVLPNIKRNEFIMQINSPLLYKTYSRRVSNPDNLPEIDLGYITLEPETQTLDEVQITASRPQVTYKQGKLVHTVQDNREMRMLNSLDEVLQRIPFVSVEDNKISVFGKKNTVVLVNGIPPKNDNWEMISPEDIKEVEVITNPSAEYSSAGMAVVNIITRKRFAEGLNGQISAGVSKGDYWRFNNALQLGYATDRINLYTSITYNPHHRTYTEKYERYFPDGSTMFNIIHQNRKTRENYHILLGADYVLNPAHTIGVQYQRMSMYPTRETSNINNWTTGGQENKILTMLNGDLLYARNIYDISYSWLTDSKGSKLAVNLGYVDYDSHENNYMDISSNGHYSQKESHSEADIRLLTGNIDYVLQTENSFTGKAGVYASHNRNKSHYSLIDKEDAHADFDVTPSNGANINEDKFAAYITGRKDWNKFYLSAGLRFEYVNYSNKDIQKNVTNKTYRDFFPSVEMGYDFSDKLQTNVSFTRKVHFPSFGDLSPTIQYIDTFTYYKGNTNLKPEYSYNLEANVIYNRFIRLSLGYSRINDALNSFFVKRLNPESMICIATTENLQSYDSWTASLTVPWQYKFWTMQNSAGYNYNRNKFESEGSIITQQKGMFYFYTYQGFKLPKAYNLSVIYRCNTSGLNGLFYHNAQHVVNLSMSKSFSDDRLTVSLRYDDVFNKNKTRAWIKCHDITFVNGMDYDNSYVSFSVKYKFGKSTRKYTVKENSKEEMKRL